MRSDHVDTARCARRSFLRFAMGSPLALGLFSCRQTAPAVSSKRPRLHNVFDYEDAARNTLPEGAFQFIADGADDLLTLHANRKDLMAMQIRARRLVDVSNVDTRVEVLGRQLATPICIAPVGLMSVLDPEAELAVARAAAKEHHLAILSSVSTYSIGEIARVTSDPLWFQLYPTPNRTVTRGLLQRAEAAGCPVLVLTVDTPVIGNRENHIEYLNQRLAGGIRLGNYEGIRNGEPINDASMDWKMIAWLRENCSMKIVLKGIVTREDAALARQHGVDAIIVSNHGGRQAECNRSTIGCLREVLKGAGGGMPVMIDGGFRRGTDVFKALALGARAVCIGRPYLWGLAAYGQDGVEQVLTILQAELVRIMQIAGTPSVGDITADSVCHGPGLPSGKNL